MAAEVEGKLKVVKIDCGAYDKKFAVGLGIKALPTFHVWFRGEKVGEMTGANEARLREFVQKHAAAP